MGFQLSKQIQMRKYQQDVGQKPPQGHEPNKTSSHIVLPHIHTHTHATSWPEQQVLVIVSIKSGQNIRCTMCQSLRLVCLIYMENPANRS